MNSAERLQHHLNKKIGGVRNHLTKNRRRRKNADTGPRLQMPLILFSKIFGAVHGRLPGERFQSFRTLIPDVLCNPISQVIAVAYRADFDMSV